MKTCPGVLTERIASICVHQIEDDKGLCESCQNELDKDNRATAYLFTLERQKESYSSGSTESILREIKHREEVLNSDYPRHQSKINVLTQELLLRL